VTKLSSVRYYGKDRHNESLRKLFVATSQDIRILIIKLTDRLHNMETLAHVPQEKQLRIARETLEIYVPVAHRLGMGKIRKELEDIAFFYVYPAEYKRVKTLLEQRAGKSNEILEKERKILQKRLADAKLLDFNTSYRVKGLYSLYHKLMRKDWEITEVYDLLAMRVVVASMEDCYRTLGIIHDLWRPLPSRMKDYIAFPKPNGYQSIHTTVTSNHGTIMEIQIRTRQMHQESEFGVASHLVYKDSVVVSGETATATGGRFTNLIPMLFRPFSRPVAPTVAVDPKKADHKERIPQWISQIGEMYTKEETAKQFMADMRQDFFTNRIFVFTPNGDVVDLPVGATPIDFAYAIHSEIGNHIAGVKVNKKLVQLETELRNGDIVEVDTKESAKPSKKWLDIAKTSLAKRHIRGELGLTIKQ
jgi:GTP pyrophosphokinase